MTTIDDILATVNVWAIANKDALPDYHSTITGGKLEDGTVVGVRFEPRTVFSEPRGIVVEPVGVYRLQRDGVFAANPFSAVSACDVAYLRSLHERTERDLARVRLRRA